MWVQALVEQRSSTADRQGQRIEEHAGRFGVRVNGAQTREVRQDLCREQEGLLEAGRRQGR